MVIMQKNLLLSGLLLSLHEYGDDHVMHRKQKITSDVKQQTTALNLMLFRFSFTLSIEHLIKSSVTLDVPIIVTRLV